MKRSSSYSRSRKNKSHTRLWIFTLIFFGLFTLGLVQLGKHQKHPHHAVSTQTQTISLPKLNSETTETAIAKKQTNETSSSSSVTTNKPAVKKTIVQFEFTTPQTKQSKLKNTKTIAPKPVTANKKATETTTAEASDKINSKPKQANSSSRYVIEIAKINTYAAADRLKARLALIGFEARLNKIKEQKKLYYSLIVGPYDETTATSKQHLLNNNHIHTTLRKL